MVAVDAIGAGTSSKPSDGLRGDFPRYNIRDMVRAERAFVSAAFGVERLAYVAGASMGAFQALEWAIQYPRAMDGAILMVPALRGSQVFRTIVLAATGVVRLDPAWQGGHYDAQPVEGLRMAGRLYYPWTVTDAWMESLGDAALEREIQGTVERASQWDAWDYIRRYEASASHDIAAPFDGDVGRALARVETRLLSLPTSTDRLLPPEPVRAALGRVPRARHVVVPSDRGHLGWRPDEGRPEARFITERIRQFIAEGGAA